MTTPTADEGVSIPALLRGARGSYAHAITHHLSAAGLDDLPHNGPFVLGAMTNRGGRAEEVVEWLGVTKQAASQLIDTLVVRGYLTREVDPEDRRRMVIGLTDRGRAAGDAVRAAIGDVGSQLAQVLTPAELAGLRAGLLALAQINHHPDYSGGKA